MDGRKVLKDLWERWTKNQAAIGFHAEVSKKGPLRVIVSQVPEKYRKALDALADEVLKAGIADVGMAYQFRVSQNDAASVKSDIGSLVSQRMSTYLDALIRNGYEAYYTMLENDVDVLQLRYELNKLSPVTGGWKRWNGEIIETSSNDVVSLIDSVCSNRSGQDESTGTE